MAPVEQARGFLQMLKINERLDKLAAAWTDFATRGMLVDSCLIQAIKDAFSEDSEDLMDEDVGDSDESDGPTSNKINALNHGRPLDDVDRLPRGNLATHAPNDAGTYTPSVDNHTLDDRVNNNRADDDHTNTDHPLSNQDSLTLPNDEEDDDYGPVESGPLMNEVCLFFFFLIPVYCAGAVGPMLHITGLRHR